MSRLLVGDRRATTLPRRVGETTPSWTHSTEAVISPNKSYPLVRTCVVRNGGACSGSFYFLFRKEPEAFARSEALPDRFFIIFAMNCQFKTEEGKYERVSMPSISLIAASVPRVQIEGRDTTKSVAYSRKYATRRGGFLLTFTKSREGPMKSGGQ